ncbi:MAG: hypothetical protein U0892_23075 [Pirellulales bacterium]
MSELGYRFRSQLLGITVVFIAVVLHVNTATLVSAQTPADKPAESAVDKTAAVAAEQAQVAERFKRLEELLLKSAEIEAASNPARAALLQQAAQQGKQAQLTELLARSAKSLEQSKFSQAADDQKLSIESLKQLLELLQSENRQDRVREQRDQVKRWIEETDRLKRLQSSLRGRTEGGQSTEQAAKDQNKLAEKAAEIAKQVGGEESKPNTSKSESDPAADKSNENGDSSKDDMPKDKPADDKSNGEKGNDKPDAAEKKDGDKKDGDKNGVEKKDADKDGGEKKDGDKKDPDKKDAESTPSGEQKSGEPKDGDPKGSDKPKDGRSDPSKSESGEPKEGSESKGSPKKDSQSPDQQQSGEQQSGDEQQQGSAEQQPKDPTERAAQRIKRAQQKMKQAQKKLEDAERKGAVEEQREAERELEAAIEELEEILRQLREEEIERSLAALDTRLRAMLQMQKTVLSETQRLADIAGDSADRQIEIRANALSLEERKVQTTGQQALLLLREEGTSAAFPEAMEQVLVDVQSVVDRLAKADIGKMTIALEEEITSSLEEMLGALEQVQKDQKKRKEQQQQQGGQQGNPGDQPLVDQLAELRLIRTLQVRVNKRTGTLSAALKDPDDVVGQAEARDLQSQLKSLGERQASIQQVTRDIVTGKNK